MTHYGQAKPPESLGVSERVNFKIPIIHAQSKQWHLLVIRRMWLGMWNVTASCSTDWWPSFQLTGSTYPWAILWDVQSMEDVLWEHSEHALAVAVGYLTAENIIYTLEIQYIFYYFNPAFKWYKHGIHHTASSTPDMMRILSENLLWLKINRMCPHTDLDGDGER